MENDLELVEATSDANSLAAFDWWKPPPTLKNLTVLPSIKFQHYEEGHWSGGDKD
jgi:hypothetical protein